jgi:glycine cleavage system H protein
MKMTAFLVVCTVAVVLGFEYWRSRRRPIAAAAESGLRVAGFEETPEGLFFGPGHTWAQIEPDGQVCVGVDGFASKVVGRIDDLEVATAGTTLERRDAAFVVHQADKSTAFAAPLEGVVTSVNEQPLRDPNRIRQDPYGENWLLRMRPRRLRRDLERLRIGEEARNWMRDEASRLARFLEGRTALDGVGATLQDGGVPVENVLEHLDREAWDQFEREFSGC